MKKLALLTVLAGLVFVFSAAAFAGDVPKDKQKGAQAPESEVVATVNGDKITKDVLDIIMQQAGGQGQQQMDTAEARKGILEKLIEMELFSQAAKRAGLESDPDYKQAIDMMQKQEALFKKQILSATYLRKKSFESVKVTPEEIQAYYEKNKDQFKTGEQVKASHILVKTEDEAKAMKARLNKGESFEAVAKDKSTCPSASKGGDLGWFGKGMMDPEFEKVAFSLKEGEVSGPIKTRFGWHIIKVTGKKTESVKPLEEVTAEISQKLQQNKQKKAYEDTLAQLRKEADIKINETALSGPKAETAPASPGAQEEKKSEEAKPGCPPVNDNAAPKK